MSDASNAFRRITVRGTILLLSALLLPSLMLSGCSDREAAIGKSVAAAQAAALRAERAQAAAEKAAESINATSAAANSSGDSSSTEDANYNSPEGRDDSEAFDNVIVSPKAPPAPTQAMQPGAGQAPGA